SLADRDGRDYAQRGLHHAVEYAARAASHALTKGHPDAQARASLETVTSGAATGFAEACVESAEEGVQASITLRDLPDGLDVTSPYELFSGEAQAACAVGGSVFGRTCILAPLAVKGVFDAEKHTLAFSMPTAALESDRLYLTERDAGADGSRH